MASFSHIRARAILSLIVALFLALLGRVAYLQTYGREATISRADRQQHLILTLQARRGDIYDRNGLMMAGSIQTHSLFVDPKFMQDSYQEDGHSLVEMDEALDRLAGIIGKDPFELAKLLGDRATSRFVKVAEDLDDSTVQQIDALNLPGVGIDSSSARCYPMGSLAAHVLGGCGADGRGLDGLELKYNDLLSGRPGFARETKDAQRRPIGVAAEDYLPPQHGHHLVLTIDANLQMIAEEELRDAVDRVHAPRGEFVVMDPYTGDVLALANYPTFNPQTLSDSTPDMRRDSALVAPYEPGSTFKPYLVGPALMWGVTTESEVWPIPGRTWFTPYGRAITDVEHYGNLCTWDGLVKSSNILMSQLSERMGNARLRRAMTSFGFGRRTGIDLPGENAGVVYPLSKWTRKSTESVAQGYELLVTPLQLARAFCVYANGGRLVTPRLLLGTVDPDGNVLSRRKRVDFDSLPRVVDPESAAEIRRILCDVVIRGTAAGQRSKIWNVSGKTGTAFIADGHGYSKTRYNSSFTACAPYENPRLVVVCVIHDPDRKIAHYGGDVAAPAVVKFFERALTYMEVPASPDLPLPPPQVADVLFDYSERAYTDRSVGAMKEDEQASEASANP
ncbi:MAG TPA: penicillin-binding protein 2 [Tepidisphaeraceae bacterium]|nr:penicillin-binding protein 2 [Tepidisphaeraceae bacterium]